jgi:hypothetical protein
MGLLWSAPVPGALAALSPWLNWATLAAAAALIYYLLLSPALAAGIAASFAVLLGLTWLLARLPWPLWRSSLAIFIVAWIGQFIGHVFEGGARHSSRTCSSCSSVPCGSWRPPTGASPAFGTLPRICQAELGAAAHPRAAPARRSVPGGLFRPRRGPRSPLG